MRALRRFLTPPTLHLLNFRLKVIKCWHQCWKVWKTSIKPCCRAIRFYLFNGEKRQFNSSKLQQGFVSVSPPKLEHCENVSWDELGNTSKRADRGFRILYLAVVEGPVPVTRFNEGKAPGTSCQWFGFRFISAGTKCFSHKKVELLTLKPFMPSILFIKEHQRRFTGFDLGKAKKCRPVWDPSELLK